MYKLTIEGLHKSYGDHQVLKRRFAQGQHRRRHQPDRRQRLG